MTNLEVVNKFIRGLPAHTLNLYSTGDKLFSYHTCIAEYHLDMLLINNTKYSNTTSRHLGMLKKLLPTTYNTIIVYLDKVPINTHDLKFIYEQQRNKY